MTVPDAAAAATAPQAAAEYVGTMLSGAARAVQNGLGSAARFVESNPVVVIVGVLVLLLLARLVRRR